VKEKNKNVHPIQEKALKKARDNSRNVSPQKKEEPRKEEKELAPKSPTKVKESKPKAGAETTLQDPSNVENIQKKGINLAKSLSPDARIINKGLNSAKEKSSKQPRNNSHNVSPLRKEESPLAKTATLEIGSPEKSLPSIIGQSPKKQKNNIRKDASKSISVHPLEKSEQKDLLHGKSSSPELRVSKVMYSSKLSESQRCKYSLK